MIDFACKRFSVDEVVTCGLGLTRAEYRVFRHILAEDTPRTADELATRLGIDVTTVQRAVKKLTEHQVVERRQQNLTRGGYVFLYLSAPKPVVRERIISILRRWLSVAEHHLRTW